MVKGPFDISNILCDSDFCPDNLPCIFVETGRMEQYKEGRWVKKGNVKTDLTQQEIDRFDYNHFEFQDFLFDAQQVEYDSDDSSVFVIDHACTSPSSAGTSDPWSLGDRTPGSRLPFVRETYDNKTLRLYYAPETATLLPDSVRRGGCFFYRTDVDLPQLGYTAKHPQGESIETTGMRSVRTTYFRNSIRMQGPPAGVAVYEYR